uniref:Peptidase_M13 domain-containing protein n=1 Tax=Macrostomum lignano TaxID=282301 RepID=A0A1I8JPC5_9PLAT
RECQLFCTNTDCNSLSANLLLQHLNWSANPCDDFYEFACGGFQRQRRYDINDFESEAYTDAPRRMTGEHLQLYRTADSSYCHDSMLGFLTLNNVSLSKRSTIVRLFGAETKYVMATVAGEVKAIVEFKRRILVDNMPMLKALLNYLVVGKAINNGPDAPTDSTLEMRRVQRHTFLTLDAMLEFPEFAVVKERISGGQCLEFTVRLMEPALVWLYRQRFPSDKAEPGYPDFAVYGAFGSLVGHEIGHGFAEQWINDASSEQSTFMQLETDTQASYQERRDSFWNETLAEDIADSMGLSAAYRAYTMARAWQNHFAAAVTPLGRFACQRYDAQLVGLCAHFQCPSASRMNHQCSEVRILVTNECRYCLTFRCLLPEISVELAARSKVVEAHLPADRSDEDEATQQLQSSRSLAPAVSKAGVRRTLLDLRPRKWLSTVEPPRLEALDIGLQWIGLGKSGSGPAAIQASWCCRNRNDGNSSSQQKQRRYYRFPASPALGDTPSPLLLDSQKNSKAGCSSAAVARALRQTRNSSDIASASADINSEEELDDDVDIDDPEVAGGSRRGRGKQRFAVRRFLLDSFRPRAPQASLSAEDGAAGQSLQPPEDEKRPKSAAAAAPWRPTRPLELPRREGRGTPSQIPLDTAYAADGVTPGSSGGGGGVGGSTWGRFLTVDSEDRQTNRAPAPPDKLQQFKNDRQRPVQQPCKVRESPGHVGPAATAASSPVDVLVVVKTPTQLQHQRRQRRSSGEIQVRENDKYIIIGPQRDSSTVDLEEIRETTLPHPGRVKLLVFDHNLNVKKAFFALVYNGLRAAPVWDSTAQRFVGMLTISDFISILHRFYRSALVPMEELESHKNQHLAARSCRTACDRLWISPEASLLDAIRLLLHAKVHRLPVVEPHTGNALFILTHKRILKYIFLNMHQLPMRSAESVCSASRQRTAGAGVDGQLVDIYSKFDVINLAATKTYNNLDLPVKEALQYRHDVSKASQPAKRLTASGAPSRRLVIAEVHRLSSLTITTCRRRGVTLRHLLSAIVLSSTKICRSPTANSIKPVSDWSNRIGELPDFNRTGYPRAGLRKTANLELPGFPCSGGLSPRYAILPVRALIRPLIRYLAAYFLTNPDYVLNKAEAPGLLFAALKRTESAPCGISMDGMRLAEAGSAGVHGRHQASAGGGDNVISVYQSTPVGAHPAAAAVLRWLLDGPVETRSAEYEPSLRRGECRCPIILRYPHKTNITDESDIVARRAHRQSVRLRRTARVSLRRACGSAKASRKPAGRIEQALPGRWVAASCWTTRRHHRLKGTELWPGRVDLRPGRTHRPRKLASDKTDRQDSRDSDRLQEAGGARGGGAAEVAQPVALARHRKWLRAA